MDMPPFRIDLTRTTDSARRRRARAHLPGVEVAALLFSNPRQAALPRASVQTVLGAERRHDDAQSIYAVSAYPKCSASCSDRPASHRDLRIWLSPGRTGGSGDMNSVPRFPGLDTGPGLCAVLAFLAPDVARSQSAAPRMCSSMSHVPATRSIGISQRLLIEPRRWTEVQARNRIEDPRRIPTGHSDPRPVVAGCAWSRKSRRWTAYQRRCAKRNPGTQYGDPLPEEARSASGRWFGDAVVG